MDAAHTGAFSKLAPGAPGDPVAFGPQYLLYGLIARGGMAEVYRSRIRGVPTGMLAIKVMRPQLAKETRFVEMFIREGRLAMLLKTDAIVNTIDVGEVEGRYYIAMEYIGGKDLTQVLRRCQETSQRIPVPHAIYIAARICDGLHFAHTLADSEGRALNIVNRDVSPSNVRLGYDGRVKLLDFGIAQAMLKVSSEIGILKGKFSYMSPEQIRGLPVDARTDVFSTGIILHEMLTTEKLFRGDTEFALMEKVRNAEVTPPSKFNRRVSAELDRIVMKALARDLPERYPSALALRDDLLALLEGYRFRPQEMEEFVRGLFRQDFAREQDELKACERTSAGARPEELEFSGVLVIEPTGTDAEKAQKLAAQLSISVPPITAPSIPAAIASASIAPIRAPTPVPSSTAAVTVKMNAMQEAPPAPPAPVVTAPPSEPGGLWARIKNKLSR